MGVGILEEKGLESFLDNSFGSYTSFGGLVALYFFFLSSLRQMTVSMNINKYADGLFLELKKKHKMCFSVSLSQRLINISPHYPY